MGRVLQDDSFREKLLQLHTRATEDSNVAARFRVVADNADVNVRVFEIGRNVDLLDRDEFRIEGAFPRDEFAEFAPDELVDPFETMFHRRES